MKKLYREYYHPNDDEKKEAIKNAYFVFDTNALLDILRYSPELSRKVLKALTNYKNTVRIPKHVADEYHKNVINTAAEIFSVVETIRTKFSFKGFEDVLNEQMKDKQNLFPKDCREKYKIQLKEWFKEIDVDLQKLEKHYKDSFVTQGIQIEIGELLKEEYLLPGLPEEEIKKIEEEGEYRYREGIPPGYKDDGKDGNKYGDLIIWKEILKLSTVDNKNIVFISNDTKEDWLYKPKNKTWGPRIELIREFNKEIEKSYPDKMFLIYTLDTFLKHIDSDLSPEEIKIISEQNRGSEHLQNPKHSSKDEMVVISRDKSASKLSDSDKTKNYGISLGNYTTSTYNIEDMESMLNE